MRALRGASYLLQPGICSGSFVWCDVELVWQLKMSLGGGLSRGGRLRLGWAAIYYIYK